MSSISQSIYKKKNIPKAVREQVWLAAYGKTFEYKCKLKWCANKINVFDFQCGHNIPESKGGTLEIDNLKPLCSRCNLSMSSNYTIDEFNKLGQPKKKDPTPWYLCC